MGEKERKMLKNIEREIVEKSESIKRIGDKQKREQAAGSVLARWLDSIISKIKGLF